MGKLLQVAIDGPASAGKSTVAKLVAHKLNYIYCDTGAMYRAVTWAAIHDRVQLDDEESLGTILDNIDIKFVPSADGQRVFVNEKEVTEEIRMPEISNNVSTVAAQVSVRKYLTDLQQKIARDGGIVMDGRDIGTTVLPNAEVKIFMVASVKERALRRYKENIEKGIQTPLGVLEREIEERDRKDSTRIISPLVKADDAAQLDTTSLTIEQVVDKIMKIIEKKA
ncbi:(d)CMP kinase [Liquorilactobacillus mali]|uniref:Cytidylate kinase n=1 Tax=Liquorilactobacillus mali KCTC 3596 = DSM 20444 TaxID=1046596 RepID=J0KXQ3_9LACO|nr:(d)CMP kinase [Liquorilactobacillus mali]EJE98462.1 cytidylate kinase [Liquorilactobacillus mali KCTC 3596 = DSM 20444]KRN09563.1 cytidylate kinase [Liquorilactobacillus mali KCTC 3596 = DSM 20444]MDC7952164.1 (d)CMP kinase [Liquorilactobacillus mali]MDV7756907.1 (d)CMP kinase [Liquorilactobacillus mali]QFQ74747.1 (d)CMP kinase [Liquorilactobacillus mali]